ncbi:MAG TPA: helix-turn-helix domain-containing protein [Solirubrobacteraceae bacterium]|nr:helix-turn-helix domain-containing protein [Solirubrobacteraceae bacterium]
MPEIGATLREARMRARIDVSEIEAQTKIRAKYLRALENEEWGLLPGPTFVKSFLRTYAQALGLDGKALVEEYRLHHERPSETPEPIVSAPQRRSTRPRSTRPGSSERGSRGYFVAVSVIGLVIVVLIALLIAGGGSSGGGTSASTPAKARARTRTAGAHGARAPSHRTSASTQTVALSLRPTAVVYVCLLGDDGRRLIPGLELQPGASTTTYHAKRFEITLGNSAVTMVIDGIPRTVPPSAEAIGYSITKAHGRHPLAPGHLPTCT